MQIFTLKSNKEHKLTSRFVGVSWNRRYQKWWAKINVDGRRFDLGFYATELEAARCYNDMAKRLGRNVLNVLPTTA
jgi:hypothetical protein